MLAEGSERGLVGRKRRRGFFMVGWWGRGWEGAFGGEDGDVGMPDIVCFFHV